MNVFQGHFTTSYYRLLEQFVNSRPEARETRAGVCCDLGPAVLELGEGANRWCLIEERGINPFLALHEISAMLSGSEQLDGFTYFVKRYSEYSDDGVTLNGAYGFRLREYFGVDQIERAIEVLREDSTSRRVCLSLWSVSDLGSASLDVPCNAFVCLKVRHGCLDLSVTCRSNDAFLGVPYNVLQFGCLQSYLASKIGVRTGRQTHFIDSLHLYECDFTRVEGIVHGTSEEKLAALVDSFPRSDFSVYAAADHYDLAARFDVLRGSDDEFSRVRDSYILARNGEIEESYRRLPRTELGLIAAWWLKQRGKGAESYLPEWFRS